MFGFLGIHSILMINSKIYSDTEILKHITKIVLQTEMIVVNT